jgi:hypothetical protein
VQNPMMFCRLSQRGETDMRTIAFNLFPEHEQDNFRSSCVRWRKRPNEFLVKAEETDVPAVPPMPIQRQVIVVHVSSAKARRYQAGQGSSWNAAFEDDLQALYFSSRQHSFENAI